MRLLLIIILLPSMILAQNIKREKMKLIYDSINELTDLNRVLFKKINEYRVSKKLKPLIYDSINNDICRKHNLYLIKNGIIGHNENNILYSDPIKRHMTKNKKSMDIGEVCSYTNNIVDLNDVESIDILAKTILDGWKHSSEHNKILLSDYNKLYLNVSTIRDIKIGSKNLIIMFSTVVLYKN